MERSQKRKKKRQQSHAPSVSRGSAEDARFDLARTTLGELQSAHDGPPPIRVGSLRKADPLDPQCRHDRVLTFPVLAKPRSVWFTDKTGDEVNGFSYGSITYERVYTEEEERAMAAAAAAQKKARQEKMEAALKASLKTAAKDAAAAAERRRHLQANASSLLLERGWHGQTGGGYQHPSSLLLSAPAQALQSPLPLPPTAHAAHKYAASLEAALPAPLSRALERLPSPVRECKRASLAVIHAADRANIDAARDRADSAAFAAKRTLLGMDDDLAAGTISGSSVSSLGGAGSIGSIDHASSVATAHTGSISASSSQRRGRLPASISSLLPAAATPLASLLALPSPLAPDPTALAAHKRHNRVPPARHCSLDIRPLPLGSYRKLRVSKHDLAVLEVITAARSGQEAASASASSGAAANTALSLGLGMGMGGSKSLLRHAERALFDSVYARHIVAVAELKERQRYVGEEEKRQRRAARVKKKDEWRTL